MTPGERVVCPCGEIVRHAEDHPGECCDCFDLGAGMSLQTINRERYNAKRRPLAARHVALKNNCLEGRRLGAELRRKNEVYKKKIRLEHGDVIFFPIGLGVPLRYAICEALGNLARRRLEEEAYQKEHGKSSWINGDALEYYSREKVLFDRIYNILTEHGVSTA
jgi:hypothetical protein